MISNALSSPARTRATRRSSPTRGSRRADALGLGSGRAPRRRPSVQYEPPAPGNVKAVRGAGVPDLPARHGGQPAGGPGRRSGACWGCGAGAQCIRAQTTVRPTRRSWCKSQLNLGQRPDLQTAAPGMLVPGALSPQRRSVHDQRRSRRAVAPMEKNAERSPRLVVVRARTRRAGNRWEPEAPYVRDRRGIPRSGWTDGRSSPDGVYSALIGLRGRLSGKRAFTRPPPPRGHADRRPTHPARFHHRAR